jgi:hypothetical protein
MSAGRSKPGPGETITQHLITASLAAGGCLNAAAYLTQTPAERSSTVLDGLEPVAHLLGAATRGEYCIRFAAVMAVAALGNIAIAAMRTH